MVKLSLQQHQKNSLSDSVLVKVYEIKADSITIDGVENVEVGNSISLFAVFNPSNTTNQNINWSVSDPEIASIDASGKLTGLKHGKVKVFATSVDGMHSECVIKVSYPSNGLVGAVSIAGVTGVGAVIIGIAKKKKKRDLQLCYCGNNPFFILIREKPMRLDSSSNSIGVYYSLSTRTM